MKLTSILAVSMGVSLGFAFAGDEQGEEEIAYSGIYLARGLSYTETDEGVVISGLWYDAEKTEAEDEDDNMCYAASAANLLAWWQNGDRAVASEAPRSLDAIWDTFVQNNQIPDEGGSTHYAINWWLTGVYAPVVGFDDNWNWTSADDTVWNRFYSSAANNITGENDDAPALTLPNYQKDKDFFAGYYYDQCGLTQQNLANFMIDVWEYESPSADMDTFEEDSGVESIVDVDFVNILRDSVISLAVISEESDSEEDIAHALTLWGVVYDKGNLSSILLTDSDDEENAIVSVSVTLNDLDGKLYLGEKTVENTFEHELYGKNVFIAGVYALNTQEALSWQMVPEPTTATLSLLALAGLAARRRRASR